MHWVKGPELSITPPDLLKPSIYLLLTKPTPNLQKETPPTNTGGVSRLKGYEQ